MIKKWKQLDSKIVYDSRFFKVRKDIVELPNKEKKEWTYWDSRDSAMVLGMTKEKKLVMIKQYRYLVDDEVIEFPSGHQNHNENIKKAAKREFEEETGFQTTSQLVKLGAFFETYGQLNRKIHIFFTNNVVKTKQALKREDDIPEDIEVILVSFNKAVRLAIDNKIVALGSALAILLLKERMNDIGKL